jgi:hypothetical protein
MDGRFVAVVEVAAKFFDYFFAYAANYSYLCVE